LAKYVRLKKIIENKSKSRTNIFVQIRPNKKFDWFRNNILQSEIPVFTFGDQIVGTLNIENLEESKVKHKGIVIRLLCQISNSSTVLYTNCLSQIQLAEQGTISLPYASSFFFASVAFPFPSYNGHSLSVIYTVQAVFSRFIRSDLECNSPIFIFRPTSSPYNVVPKTSSIYYDPFKVKIEYSLNSTEFSYQDSIMGRISVVEAQEDSITSLTLRFIIKEKLKINTTSKKFQKSLCNYQLLDGTPLKPITTPFILQLAPFKLTTIKEPPIKTKYLIEFQLSTKDGAVTSAFDTIFLYQPFDHHSNPP